MSQKKMYLEGIHFFSILKALVCNLIGLQQLIPEKRQTETESFLPTTHWTTNKGKTFFQPLVLLLKDEYIYAHIGVFISKIAVSTETRE